MQAKDVVTYFKIPGHSLRGPEINDGDGGWDSRSSSRGELLRKAILSLKQRIAGW
jgi:hypothetical protein